MSQQGRGGRGSARSHAGGRGGGAYTPQQRFSSTQQHQQGLPMAAMKNLTLEGVCESNIFIIDVAKGAKAYQYDVNISRVESASGKAKSLAKGADDGQRNLHKRLCLAIINFIQKNIDFLGLPNGAAITYDGKAMLYSSEPLKLAQNEFHLDIKAMKGDQFIQRYINPKDHSEVIVSIKPTEMKDGGVKQHAVLLDDVSQYQDGRSLLSEKRMMRTCLEMITSQSVLDSGEYSSVAAGKLFLSKADRDDIGLGLCFRAGVDKGVKVVTDDGEPKPAVVLDSKYSLFYKPQPLATTLQAIFDQNRGSGDKWQVALDLLEGVRVTLTHRPHRSIVINKWTERGVGADQCEIPCGDQRVNLSTYFNQTYSITLANRGETAERCVIAKSHPKSKITEILPVELCRIMPDQRVSQERKEGIMNDRFRRLAIIPTYERRERIRQHAEALGLFDPTNSKHMAFGIRVSSPKQVDIKRRSLPGINFGQAHLPVQPDVERTVWNMPRGATYFQVEATLERWMMVYHSADEELVKGFYTELSRQCTTRMGVQIKPPQRRQLDKIESLEEVFKECTDKKAQFLMLIDQKEGVANKTHGILKLLEALVKVRTQHISLEKAREVVDGGKWKTMENMLHKLNIKLGGLNYQPVPESIASAYDLKNGETLVIGYDVSHPSTGTISIPYRVAMKKKGVNLDGVDFLHPSVVGICGNFADNPYTFAGDYFYQEARKEEVVAAKLKDYVKWMLTQFMRARAKTGKASHVPKNVIVLRDGISEGQYGTLAMNEELPTIQQAIKEVVTQLKSSPKPPMPKLMFVVGTKRHFKRFFDVASDGQVNNLKPGTVISNGVTRADCPERYIQAHRPLQGTAKMVQYTTLRNDINMSNDQLEALLLALSFSHQISNCATSLPEPIYQADELAKRGKNNFDALRKFMPQLLEQVTDKDGRVNFDQLTQLLGYRGSTLECLRVTA